MRLILEPLNTAFLGTTPLVAQAAHHTAAFLPDSLKQSAHHHIRVVNIHSSGTLGCTRVQHVSELCLVLVPHHVARLNHLTNNYIAIISNSIPGHIRTAAFAISIRIPFASLLSSILISLEPCKHV
jgi:hypothetical protein